MSSTAEHVEGLRRPRVKYFAKDSLLEASDVSFNLPFDKNQWPLPNHTGPGADHYRDWKVISTEDFCCYGFLQAFFEQLSTGWSFYEVRVLLQSRPVDVYKYLRQIRLR